MPITKITIENFKGIADMVEIPIRPITLFFGANSAGKSTILQALLYLRELLEGRTPDVDRLMAGGDGSDLGGFLEFVHGRDRTRRIRIGLTMTLDDDGLPLVGSTSGEVDSNLPEELAGVKEVSVDVCVEWSVPHARPFITHYQVGLDGIPFAAIRTRPGGESQLDVVNLKHPLVAIDDDGTAVLFDELANAFNLNFFLRPLLGTEDDDVRGDQRLLLGAQPVPDFNRGMSEAWAFPAQSDEQRVAAQRAFAVLNHAMTGAGQVVVNELRAIRYIGPIRRIPERNFQAQRSPRHDRWSDGSGAWDLICNSNTSHDWLDPKAIRNLGLGLELEQYRFYEVPVASCLGVLLDVIRASGDDLDHGGDTDQGIVASEIRELREKSRLQLVSEATGLTLQPCEVGVGVSQVLPVALGAMAPGYSILAVEQPELHIHPAIQCNLGDLLAAQVIGDQDRVILLETHSEHLMLRLLRRIRENTESELPPDAPAISPDHLSVLWVEQDNGVVRIEPIPVNAQGDFDGKWPKGFFEERANELF